MTTNNNNSINNSGTLAASAGPIAGTPQPQQQPPQEKPQIVLKIDIEAKRKYTKLRFSSNMTITECIEEIWDKEGERHKDHGLFFPGDAKRKPMWLNPERKLSFYVLHDLETLIYKKKLRPFKCKIIDSQRTLLIDDSSMVSDIVLAVAKHIGLKQEAAVEFGLRKENDKRSWLVGTHSLYEEDVVQTDILCFARQFFVLSLDQSDPVQLELMYAQSKDSILSEEYPCARKDAIEFAALQFQISFGDHNPKRHNAGFLNLEYFLPLQWRKEPGIETDILTAHKILYGTSIASARYKYYSHMRTLRSFRFAFFNCHQTHQILSEKPINDKTESKDDKSMKDDSSVKKEEKNILKQEKQENPKDKMIEPSTLHKDDKSMKDDSSVKLNSLPKEEGKIILQEKQEKPPITNCVENRLLDNIDTNMTFKTALGPLILLRKTESPVTFEESIKLAYLDEFDEMTFEGNFPFGEKIYDSLSSPEIDYGLTRNEVLSIYFYTLEWTPNYLNLYSRLNRDLSTSGRDQEAPKWKHFLHYFINGLRKLPKWISDQDLYRGVNQNLVKNYPQKYVKGAEITWYGFTSTSTNFDKIMSFIGKASEGTIFSINGCISGRSINSFSGHPEEAEVLIPLGSRFKIISINQIGNITFIQLRQIPSLEKILKLE